MKALKISLYQSAVNYRQDNLGYTGILSYPLPTPSMVRGMIHHLLGAKEYIPMKISIQGNFTSAAASMQRMYKTDRSVEGRRKDHERNVAAGKASGEFKPGKTIKIFDSERILSQTLVFVEELHEVSVHAHIVFDDESYLEKLKDKVNNSVVVLGRNSDICRVDFCDIVDLNAISDDVELSCSMFLAEEDAKSNKVIGTRYKVPFKYEIDSYTNARMFTRVPVRYVPKGSVLFKGDVYVDNEGLPVSLLSA